MTKRLPIGPEDTVNEIDTNADGKPDVRVITDNAPQQGIVDDGLVVTPLPTEGPLSASEFDSVSAWKPEYRSMLDSPRHPLHHLRDA